MSTLPRLTPSQREVIGIATHPLNAGTEVNVIKIECGNSGISTAAKLAERHCNFTPGAPRSIRLLATSNWDAEMSMIKIGGKGCYGSGHADIVERCLKRLAGDDKRPLCLWLDRAGRMRIPDQEDFAGRVEWCANHNGLAVRLIYLIQKTVIWNQEKQRKERDWLLSEPLLRSAKSQFTFSAKGLDEVIGDETTISETASESNIRRLA